MISKLLKELLNEPLIVPGIEVELPVSPPKLIKLPVKPNDPENSFIPVDILALANDS